MEQQMRVPGSVGSRKARASFGSYLGELPCQVIWNSRALQCKRRLAGLGTRSSRRIAKGL